MDLNGNDVMETVPTLGVLHLLRVLRQPHIVTRGGADPSSLFPIEGRMVFIKVATSPPQGSIRWGRGSPRGAGFWGSALTVKRDLGLGEGRSALCLIKDVTRRPLLIQGQE